MEIGIKVNIEDLLEKIEEARKDEFNTVELVLVGGDFEDDTELQISGISVIDGQRVEYGAVQYDSGELE